MLPQQYCLRWKYHHSNLQTMFSQLLDRGCFCDVTLACEGQLIRAHRVVLCACSTFFDTVLTNYASERDPIIIMKDVTFADVKSLIEFMYKGEINVEHANLASLLKTADDLKIKGLAEVSWRDDEDIAHGGGAPPPAPDAEFGTHAQDMRTSPHANVERRNVLSSPAPSHKQHLPPSQLPMLTPIPSSISIGNASAELYLGPKRKRGRPPLDDAYDVFNVRKMAHFAGQHLDSQSFLESGGRLHASHHEDQRRHASTAYQQHIHQQQRRQRQKQEQHHAADSDVDADDIQTDPEWITSNLEVNVGECETVAMAPMENSDESEAAQSVHKLEFNKEDALVKSPSAIRRREKTPETKSSTVDKTSPKPERFKKRSMNEKAQREQRQRESKEKDKDSEDTDLHSLSHRNSEHEEEQPLLLPQPVEEIEKVQQVLQQQAVLAAATTTAATTTTSSSSSSAAELPSTSAPTKISTNSSHSHGIAHAHTHIPPAHSHFAKYGPPEGGYVLNEHGMLMTHDFPPHSVSGASAANGNGNGDQEFVDIKMEDYDAADMRLTSEEMSQWQDVIKMDDYLAKGRRPQFWEEPFTRRVLDAIKNKRLEMKKAARILGVSYGTLYGRYREVYGCLKHPYSSTFRPSQSSQLTAVQPRFDIVWPSPKRDSNMLPAPLEIGKIRPKDLSELWARPQI